MLPTFLPAPKPFTSPFADSRDEELLVANMVIFEKSIETSLKGSGDVPTFNPTEVFPSVAATLLNLPVTPSISNEVTAPVIETLPVFSSTATVPADPKLTVGSGFFNTYLLSLASKSTNMDLPSESVTSVNATV